MEFKIDRLTEVHPKIWSIRCSKFDDLIKVVHSPSGNCQSFSLMYAKQLGYLDEYELSKFLEEVYDLTDKMQMIIDLNLDISEGLLKQLEPFCKNIQKMQYESTNRSKMVLCLIQIDLNKIKEFNDRKT